MLFVESYGAGSHLRIAQILQEQSSHQIDIVLLARDHWRSLAFAGHRAIAAAMKDVPSSHYDAVVFSGPADVARSASALPERWGRVPIISYFHESQWTYPADGVDRLPHLISHLEAVEASDVVLFNSRYHREVFYKSAWSHQSSFVRAIARRVLSEHWAKADVVSPPVETRRRESRRGDLLTIAWSARWEQDKRPDLLLRIVDRLLKAGANLELHILGCDMDRWMAAPEMNDAILKAIHPHSGFLCREEYEAVLSAATLWLSTAEHEFFGVSAIEAAMLGAVPVVPDGLAYRETLPSAFTYPPGDVDAAVRRILAISELSQPVIGPWTADACRFDVKLSVSQFDRAFERAASSA